MSNHYEATGGGAAGKGGSKADGIKQDQEASVGVSLEYEARPILIVKKARTHVNHSYRDFSRIPSTISDDVKESKVKSFSEKLHEILSTEEYKHYINWMPHGRAFRVLIPKRFEKKVSPKYFGHSRYSSFLRQLNNHGFKHISHGPDRNAYYHEAFLRGMPHLCKYMPAPKNARRLIPDPDNEPNFYEIEKSFPLPDKAAKSSPSEQAAVQNPVTGKPQELSKPAAVPSQVVSAGDCQGIHTTAASAASTSDLQDRLLMNNIHSAAAAQRHAGVLAQQLAAQHAAATAVSTGPQQGSVLDAYGQGDVTANALVANALASDHQLLAARRNASQMSQTSEGVGAFASIRSAQLMQHDLNAQLALLNYHASFR